MSYSLVVTPEAEADLADAKRWYERQRKGLGEQFLERVDELLARLCETPEIMRWSWKTFDAV